MDRGLLMGTMAYGMAAVAGISYYVGLEAWAVFSAVVAVVNSNLAVKEES